jgi:tetratricopeptide (TPR) repeat protein
MPGAGNKLSEEKIDAIRQQAVELAHKGDLTAVWRAVAPLRRAQSRDKRAAMALLKIVQDDCLSREHALATLEAVDAKHGGDMDLVALIGENLDRATDINFLNAAVPDHPIFPRTISALENAWARVDDVSEVRLLDGLSTAARLFGRQKDDLAERAYKRLIELDPDTAYRYYNYGLFLKTRGRFEEGVQANLTAAALSKKTSEATQWNLGICATGAGKGDVALKVWKDLGQHVELGRFGLPDGSYPACKVRLAERPLSARVAETDDPGQEETVWIERVSACHGIIRSVLYYDLGVNYGDVVMFDGAPITQHKYDDEDVPVFPHLATLLRRHYHVFAFGGTQDKPGRLADVGTALKGDAVVYSHTENFVVLCANCWNNPDTNHARHPRIKKHVVTGRITAPPDMSLRELLDQLDARISEIAPCQIYVPDLCEAAGFPDRARVERRRFDMLANN